MGFLPVIAFLRWPLELESGDLVIGRSGDRKSEEAATKILRKTRNQLLATQMRADYSSGK
jgi:hypothetical protein